MINKDKRNGVITMVGNLTDFQLINNDRTLRITLTKRGKELVDEVIENGTNIHSDQFFLDMIEYQLCNGWDLICQQEIGALTGALLLSQDVQRDDQGVLVSVVSVYSNIAHYQIYSPVQEMIETGYVDFELARND